MQIPGAQIDLAESVVEQKQQVDALTAQVATQDADDQQRLKMTRQLAEQAEELGKVREALRLARLSDFNPWGGFTEREKERLGIQGTREEIRRILELHRDNDPPDASPGARL